MSFDKLHLRHCLLFVFQQNKNAAEAQTLICRALGQNAVSYSTCKKWFQRFKTGNLDLNDEERPGQPKKVEDVELEKLLEENPYWTPSQLAESLGVTRQAISKRLHKLGKVRKRASDQPISTSIANKNTKYDAVPAKIEKSQNSVDNH